MLSIAYSFPLLILFTSLPIFLQSVSAQNEVTCISNYAEMKQALLQEGSGNKERLLYAFTPPNQPLPHYIWVYYYHNQSSEWSDILTCPPSLSVSRCPESSNIEILNGKSNNSSNDHWFFHAIFWGDSATLINLDIPLLELLTYNLILRYLQPSSCVQLVIPPICSSVDQDSERKILNLATSYLRSYSTSDQESERDYVLNCYEKFTTESSYNAYLLSSELIIGFGSWFFLTYVSIKLSLKKKNMDEENQGNNSDGNPQQTDQDSSSSGKDGDKQQKKEVGNIFSQYFETDNSIQTHKKYFFMVLSINIITIFFVITDAVQFGLSKDVVHDAFSYAYGGLYVILFAVAGLLLLIKTGFIIIYMIGFCMIKCKCCKITRNGNILTVSSAFITPFLFWYILSRTFWVALAFATYPFEVGFILLAIGSGVVAILFIVWAIVHIALDSYEANMQWLSLAISLVPYGPLLVIMVGFLLSYIRVVVSVNIRMADPIASLVITLVPGVIAVVTKKSYRSELKVINDRNADKGRQTRQENSSINQPVPTLPTEADESSAEQARPPATHTNLTGMTAVSVSSEPLL